MMLTEKYKTLIASIKRHRLAITVGFLAGVAGVGLSVALHPTIQAPTEGMIIRRNMVPRVSPVSKRRRSLPRRPVTVVKKSSSSKSSVPMAPYIRPASSTASSITSSSSKSIQAVREPLRPIAQKKSSASVRNTSVSSSSFVSSISSASLPTGQAGSSILHEAAAPDFPAYERTVFPVSKTPNWGVMDSPQQWERTYSEMTDADFVGLPRYDLARLMTPMESLLENRHASAPDITAKLFYSTRYFGKYDLDAGEFGAVHPGIDLKLALGTPVGAIAGGRVHAVRSTGGLGLHVIIEHRIGKETYYSIYGHFGSVSAQVGQNVRPGATVGRVGMTGNTTAPHLHLQVDRGEPDEAKHLVYWPSKLPSVGEAAKYTVNPISFIQEHSTSVATK